MKRKLTITAALLILISAVSMAQHSKMQLLAPLTRDTLAVVDTNYTGFYDPFTGDRIPTAITIRVTSTSLDTLIVKERRYFSKIAPDRSNAGDSAYVPIAILRDGAVTDTSGTVIFKPVIGDNTYSASIKLLDPQYENFGLFKKSPVGYKPSTIWYIEIIITY